MNNLRRRNQDIYLVSTRQVASISSYSANTTGIIGQTYQLDFSNPTNNRYFFSRIPVTIKYRQRSQYKYSDGSVKYGSYSSTSTDTNTFQLEYTKYNSYLSVKGVSLSPASSSWWYSMGTSGGTGSNYSDMFSISKAETRTFTINMFLNYYNENGTYTQVSFGTFTLTVTKPNAGNFDGITATITA